MDDHRDLTGAYYVRLLIHRFTSKLARQYSGAFRRTLIEKHGAQLNCVVKQYVVNQKSKRGQSIDSTAKSNTDSKRDGYVQSFLNLQPMPQELMPSFSKYILQFIITHQEYRGRFLANVCDYERGFLLDVINVGGYFASSPDIVAQISIATNSEKIAERALVESNETAISDNYWLQDIMKNWSNNSVSLNNGVHSAIFQIFRIYKPEDPATSKRNMAELNVVIECMYADFDQKRLVLITTDLDIYLGSFTISNNYVLYALMQKTHARAGGLAHRMLGIKIHTEWLNSPILSGAMLKTGDTLGRVVSSELLINKIPENTAEYHDMINQFENILDASGQISRISDSSCLANFLSFSPAVQNALNAEKIVKVKNVPLISALTSSDEGKVKFMREPLRSLTVDTLLREHKKHPLEIFRRNK